MYSENNDINDSNYEEAFLLYADGELSPAAVCSVDAYLVANPHLQTELDALLATRLDASPVAMPRLALYAQAMHTAALEETMLRSLDNELAPEQEVALQQSIKADAALTAEWKAWLATRLTAEPIPFPDKKSLYRQTQTARVLPMRLLRRMAAASVVGLIGWLAASTLLTSPKAAAFPPLSKTAASPATIATSPTLPAQPSTTQPSKTQTVPALMAKALKPTPQTLPMAESSDPPTQKIEPHTSADLASHAVPTASNSRSPITEIPKPSLQQSINTPTVTSASLPAYRTIEVAAAAPLPSDVHPSMATPDGKNRGSVKGLLRRATRFIEKRTGVAVVNDQGELLAGPLRIAL